MKIFVLFFLFLISLNAMSLTIKIDDWKKNRDMERSIVLISQTLETPLNIDCQSFIQGLWFGEYEEARVVSMEPDHCMKVLGNIKRSISRGRSHCIEVDDQVKKDYLCR